MEIRYTLALKMKCIWQELRDLPLAEETGRAVYSM